MTSEAPTRSPAVPWTHPAIAGLLAVAAGTAMALARIAGVMDGVAGVVAATLLLVAFPSSRTFARRILINIGLVLGAVPLLWWVQLPLGALGRVGLVLSMALGALVWWVAATTDRTARIRRLVPTISAIDGAPVAAVAGTAWVTGPLLSPASGDRTLNLLMHSGWDHAPHFAMVNAIRSEGAITPFLGAAPDGTPWVGATYPQHFHSLVASMIELVDGPDAGGATSEVLGYGRGLALLLMLVIGALCAGLAQLPGFRERPELGYPAAGLVFAGFVVGPGAVYFTSGFPNLVFAAATALLTLLVATACAERCSLGRLAALAGLVVATAHAWLPVVIVAVPAACFALPEVQRALRARSRRDMIGVGALGVVTAGAAIAVVPILHGSGVAGQLDSGGAAEFSLSLLIVATLGALAVSVTAMRSIGSRALPLASVPATGIVLVVGLGGYQLARTGEFAYYFGKLVLAVSLVCLGVLATAIGLRVNALRARGLGMRSRSVVGVAATVAAIQVFGYVGPQRSKQFAGTAALLEYRQSAKVLMSGPSGEALRMLSAADHMRRFPFGSVTYLGTQPADPHPLLSDQWAHGLSRTWSAAAAAPLSGLRLERFTDAEVAARTATELLRADPSRRVVLPREDAAAVRALVPGVLRDRVLST